MCLGDEAGDPVPSDNRLYVYDGAVLAEYAPDPDALLKARRYLYGTALLTAESSDRAPSPSPEHRLLPSRPPSAPRST